MARGSLRGSSRSRRSSWSLSKVTRLRKRPRVWEWRPRSIRGWLKKFARGRRRAQRRGGLAGRAASSPRGEQAAPHGAGDFKKSDGLLRQGAAVKFAFIEDHQAEFPVETMCHVLEVSRSGYYAWQQRPASPTALRQAALVEQIQQIHEDSRQIYGSPRVHRELAARGVKCSENTVAKLMRKTGIRSKMRKRFRGSHDRQPARASDCSQHARTDSFNSSSPTRPGPPTSPTFPTGEGWLYLAAVIDLCSRKIVGWATADSLAAELVCQALQMALLQRHAAASRCCTTAIAACSTPATTIRRCWRRMASSPA